MEVLVTPRAEKHFDSIVDFINAKWGERTAKQFVIKTDEIFQLLKNYPEIGQIENGDIRGFQLSRQTRLLYESETKKLLSWLFSTCDEIQIRSSVKQLQPTTTPMCHCRVSVSGMYYL